MIEYGIVDRRHGNLDGVTPIVPNASSAAQRCGVGWMPLLGAGCHLVDHGLKPRKPEKGSSTLSLINVYEVVHEVVTNELECRPELTTEHAHVGVGIVARFAHPRHEILNEGVAAAIALQPRLETVLEPHACLPHCSVKEPSRRRWMRRPRIARSSEASESREAT